MAENTVTKKSSGAKKGKPALKTESKPKKTTQSKPKETSKMVKADHTKDPTKLAVIDVNGTQLLVREGGTYEMNKLDGLKGDTLEITQVLLYANGSDVKVGMPFVEGAKVVAKIDSQKKGDKLRVFKFKAKARYRRTYGSRSLVTRLEIVQITA